MIKKSLLNKSLLVIAFLLLPLLCSLYYIYLQNQEYLESEAFREAENLSGIFKDRTNQFIKISRERAKDFASDGFLREVLETKRIDGSTAPEIGRYLAKNKLILDKNISSINVVTDDGAILASTNSGLAGKKLKISLINSETVSAFAVPDPEERGSMLAFAAPLRKGIGGRYYLVNFIKLEDLGKTFSFDPFDGLLEMHFLSRLTMPAKIYFFDGGGRVFYSSDKSFSGKVQARPPEDACLSESGKFAGYYLNAANVEVAGVSSCIPEFSWNVVAEIRKQDIFSPILAIEKAILVGTGSVGLLLILFFFFFRVVLKPIRELGRAMNVVAFGGYDVKLPVNADDEIGALSRSFNKMIEEIRNKDFRLKASEEKFKSLVESTSDLVWEINGEGVYTYVSPKARDILGYEPAEVLGRSPFDLMPPEEAKRIGEVFAEIAKSRTPFNFLENTNKHKDGRLIVLETNGVPILGKNGELTGYRGIDRDITERKKIRQALHESEGRYRRIFENSKDAIIISKKDGTLLDANKAAIELFKLRSREELRQHKSTDFYLNSLDRTGFVQELEAKGFVKKIEISARDKKDNRLVLQISATLFTDTDGEISYLSIIRDITEQRQLEMQLLQAQKMESVGQLTNGIAHDFNNILTALIGYSKLLDSKIKEDDPLKVFSREIIDLTSDASEFIKQLLIFSRKNEAERMPVEVASIISDVESVLSRTIGENITLDIRHCDAEAVILANSTQIEQALINLSINAKDAMPDGGTLSIRASVVEHEEKFSSVHGYGEPGKYVVITLSDTGTGIDERILTNIFDPFFTTKPAGKGTGLGLSMVYWIIKQHHGYMSVTSSQNRGSSFIIHLPLLDTRMEEGACEDNALVMGNRETVLVLEDDEVVSDFLNVLLDHHNYRAVFARSGHDALRTFNELGKDIDLVIGDIRLPDKNILEIFSEIRRTNPSVKFIFMSGYPIEFVEDQLESIRGEGIFLQKPFRAEELLLTLKETFGGKAGHE